jgi:hypothetical protein
LPPGAAVARALAASPDEDVMDPELAVVAGRKGNTKVMQRYFGY